MSLDMILELEGASPDWVLIASAIRAVGAKDLVVEADGLEGTFARSFTYFYTYGQDRPLGPISAEGQHGCDFLRKYDLVFRINNSLYDESVADLHDFLQLLAKRDPMRFVLSFQLEGVRAVRDDGDLEWFWDDPL